MTRNSQTLTAYLDQCQAEEDLKKAATTESLTRYGEMLRDGLAETLYEEAQADGWSTAEIEKAYRQRFGK